MSGPMSAPMPPELPRHPDLLVEQVHVVVDLDEEHQRALSKK